MKNRIGIWVAFSFLLFCLKSYAQPTGNEDRWYWVNTMVKIANPVLDNLSQGTLKKNMPFESLSTEPLRREVSYLEAVGRTICGIAPWLELGQDQTKEGKLRAKYIQMTLKGLKNAVNPDSPDYLMFDNRHFQPLVDAAHLVQGILRAPKQIWGNLDKETQVRLIKELKRTRGIKPKESNWLLFASMVEAALLEFTGECDTYRLNYGIHRFLEDGWYKGDAWYGDGQEFHLDFYNSIVIHPMLTDILAIMKKHNLEGGENLDKQIIRQQRLSEQLERLISPEGTYPAVGRSIVYRFGIFHALSQMSLMKRLPEKLLGGQVRCALTAVLHRQFATPNNFDKNGWLKIGLSGNQINMSESYINTGSLYMCATIFLALGLPAEDSFWTETYMECVAADDIRQESLADGGARHLEGEVAPTVAGVEDNASLPGAPDLRFHMAAAVDDRIPHALVHMAEHIPGAQHRRDLLLGNDRVAHMDHHRTAGLLSDPDGLL